MKTVNLQSMKRELRMARNLAAVATFAFGMAACTQNEEQQLEATPAPHSPVNIIAGVEGIQTRADGITGEGIGFNDGSKIKVVDVNDAGDTPLFSIYTYASAGSEWTPEPILYWDNLTIKGEDYNLAGIWPENASLTYTADGTSEILIALSGNVKAKAGTIKLDFKHVLSQITVVIQPDKTTFPADEFNVLTPEISLTGIKDGATFNYTADAEGFAGFTLGGTAQSFASGALTPSESKVSHTFIIPAQALGNITFKLDANKTYTYAASTITSRQGHNTTITLTLKKTALTTPTITVTKWAEDSEDNKTGDIGM